MRGRRGGAPLSYRPDSFGIEARVGLGFRGLSIRPFSLMCSASFGTVPERSRAPRGGGRNSPASGEYLPPRTLDGEDPFRILVAQGKGAASSSLPQAASSFRLPPRSVLSNRRRIQ